MHRYKECQNPAQTYSAELSVRYHYYDSTSGAECNFTESYLSFLGLGVSAPLTSLGSLANDARAGMQSYPLRLVIPAIAICLIVLALNLLGDGLRDAFDSKLN